MAATATLVFAGNNRLRYLIAGDEMGGSVTIPNAGGASPDLLTDVLPGPLRQIVRANLDGIGTIAPGALTQAQARALLLSDGSAANVGNNRVPRAICRLTDRTIGATPAPNVVDANVDMNGAPVITVTMDADAVAYLDIELANGIGVAAAG